jgi:hypothetical protein
MLKTGEGEVPPHPPFPASMESPIIYTGGLERSATLSLSSSSKVTEHPRGSAVSFSRTYGLVSKPCSFPSDVWIQTLSVARIKVPSIRR